MHDLEFLIDMLIKFNIIIKITTTPTTPTTPAILYNRSTKWRFAAIDIVFAEIMDR